MSGRVGLVCVVAVGLVVAGVADGEVSLELTGQWGGSCYGVAVRDGIAYVGIGPRLVVLDITEPAEPRRLGQSVVLPNEVRQICVSGPYAYVAGEGLYVIDVSDPTDLRWVGSYTGDSSTDPVDVVVVDHYAYTVDLDDGLQVLDVSDPCAPTWTGGCPLSDHGQRVAVAGNYAYVLTWYALNVIDISNSAAPVRVGRLGYDWAEDMAVQDGYAYITGGYYDGPNFICGLKIVDVTDPRTPHQAAFYQRECYADAVTVVGDYAYMTIDANSLAAALEVIDVSNPDAPACVGTCPTPGAVFMPNVAIADGHAYVADVFAGLVVFDVDDAAAPVRVGAYSDMGCGYDVAVSGAYAYVNGDGLHIIEVTDPRNPALHAVYSGGGNPEVVEDRAYLADGYEGLKIVDVSDPAEPVTLGSLGTVDCAIEAVVQGNYAYVADRVGGLLVVDVGDPRAPFLVGSCASCRAWGVDVAGEFAYVADTHAGLRIVDVSNPGAPFQVGLCAAEEPRSVEVAGQYAYVTTLNDGFDVIDVADPYHPQSVARVDGYGPAYGITVQGNYAYLASTRALFVFDVSEPREPALVGEYRTSGDPFGVDVRGGYAYVADYECGLAILAVYIPGDMNCDGLVDNFDITPFVKALTDPAAYHAGYPDCHILNGDINGDGLVNNFDITPFVQLLVGE